MKKHITILALIFLTNLTVAQNDILENKNWEIQEFSRIFKDAPDNKISLFSVNDSNNILNYEGLTSAFNSTICSIFYKNDPNVKTEYEWQFTKNKDTIVINKQKYNIIKLTDNELSLSLDKFYIDNQDEKLYPMTDYYSYKLATTLSVNQNKINKKHKQFPNPVADKLFLTFESSLNATKVEIYGLDGRQLVSQAVKPNQEVQEINVQEFPKGFYFLKIKDKNDKVLDSGKILKK
jgi:Secretion system C-terminal sorting domain